MFISTLQSSKLPMRLRPFVLSLMILASLVPFVPGATAWTCVPAEDETASEVSIGVGTYYNRLYRSGSSTFEQVWEERNGEPGLQTSDGMSCVGHADRLIRSACLGCPMQG